MLIFLFVISWFDWQVIKNDDFLVVYKPGYEWEARQALLAADESRALVWRLTGNQPCRLPVVIEDIGTSSNGFADPVFYSMHFYTFPPAAGLASEGIQDWYRTLAVHEYTHVAHLTKTAGIPRGLTSVLGRLFQPNMYSPGWIIEGITVYAESQVSPYEGRLNDGFFDAYLASRASTGRFPSIVEATNEPLSFPPGKIYLYGGTFFEYLSREYGAERFARFFKIYGSYPWAPFSAFFPCLGLDIAARRVYGRTFPALFSEWRLYEEQEYSQWKNPGIRITRQGWHVTPLKERSGKLYYARTRTIKSDAFRGTTVTDVIEHDPETGQERSLCRLDRPVTSALRIREGSVYFTTAEVRRAENVSERGFGITSVVHRLCMVSGRLETLFRDDIRAFCVLPDGSILFSKDRAHSFGSELWRYEETSGRRVKVREDDRLINELDADTARILVTARQNGENWDICVLDLETGLHPLVVSPWSEGSIDLKDEACIFSANYGSRYAVFLCDLSDTSLYELTGSGSAHAGEIIGDTLYYAGLTADGFDIFKTPLECRPAPAFGPPSIAPPSPPSSYQQGGYLDVCATLLPAVRIPFIFPADTTWRSWVYGGLIAGQDATNENFYTLVMGYDQLGRKPVIDLALDSYFFAPVPLTLNYAHGDGLNIRADYPLFYRLQPGLSHLLLSCSARSFDSHRRKELTPIMQTGFDGPFVRISVAARIPLERKTYGSEIDRTGYIARCAADLIAAGGSLGLSATGFSDAQNPDTPSVRLRGLEPSHRAPRGLVIRTEYSHRFFPVRRGLWNPNIYFEDLFGSVFYETVLLGTGGRHSSVGIAIKIETKTAFGFIPLVPSVGLAWDPDPDPGLEQNWLPRVFLTLVSAIDL